MDKNKIKNKLWPIKITIITFLLAILFSYLSQMATFSNELFVPTLILIIMIFTSIIADGIAVSATSCDVDRLRQIANTNKLEYTISLKLVLNAEKVNNICADVIGDMCGILSGACGATIVAKATYVEYNYLYAICLSSLIVALTVGGKAYLKGLAVNSAEEFILSTAKLIKLFVGRKDGNFRKNKITKRFKKFKHR